MNAIEILVPEPALSSVKKALGVLPSTTFHTRPSPHTEPDLVLSSLELLDTPGRQVLAALLDTLPGKAGVALVLFEAFGIAPGVAGLEALARLSHQARREPYIAPNLDAVRRLVLAHQSGAEKHLVASASVEDGQLIVWSCEPRRFEVSVAQVPALARMPAGALATFEVSASGSRIRWPAADVDINLDTVREYADADVRREHEAHARREAARYAKAIRRLRHEHGLKQSDIAGLTERQVRRLEEGGTVPQIETLRRLAAAHGLGVDDYLSELAKRSRKSAQRPSTSRSRRRA